jgi:TolA-binding protein
MNPELKSSAQIKPIGRLQVALTIVLSMLAAAVTVIGCAWSGTSHSVRFNGYQTEREMGRLPPLPTLANGLNEKRRFWDADEVESEADYTAAETESEQVNSLWDRATAAEEDGNLRLDRDLLKEYLNRTHPSRDYWAFSDKRQQRRNSAFDRLDVLSALDHGVNASKVKPYLDARRLYDADKPPAEEVARALDMVPAVFNLKDNVAYLRAAELYRQGQFAQAASAFNTLARQYSRSEKREAALFMTGVATMKTSATYVPASGNSGYDYGEDIELSTDQAWYDAFRAFQKVIDEHPRGRYFNDARSWQAYLLLRRRDRAGALAQYYRLLADPDENARTEAAFSLTLVRSPATEDEMSRVEQDLANEPQAALTYAYHNIYNYSIDPGDEWPEYEEVRNSSGEYDFEASRARNVELQREWRTERANTSRKDLIRTLEFSKALMARYPNLPLGGAFALRAAQASKELDDNGAAVSFARRALQSHLNNDERRDSLWTLGVAQHRLRQFDEARGNFETLLRDYPSTNLTEGARRMLAMIAEDAGDIDGALEQYVALDYNVDVAYFVDILMTPEQLAAFIQKHPDSPKQNEFTYALGVRYLRANRWEDARQTFARVRTDSVSDYNYYCDKCDCDPGETTNCVDPKADAFLTDEDGNGKKQVSPQLVMRDVQTANDLEALERAAEQAVGGEDKAEALYQYASYQYEASSLLFYNPLAYPGYFYLGEFAGQGRYRVPNESQTLFESMQRHERLARALRIYLEVAKKFPHTRAARDALYTAAVCHERLSNYNPYWRGIYVHGLHAGERMVTYADVKAAYPDYQLPRGTYGWQPKTRTVNDGPGWAAPLKPPRRLTKREQLKFFINEISERLSYFWNQNGKRWLTESVIVLGLVFTVRIARRNQRRLRARIARRRKEETKQVVTYPWFALFWIDPERPGRREQIRKFFQDQRQEFIALLRDHRSRPVLFRSIISHTAVTGLALSLLWTIWFG